MRENPFPKVSFGGLGDSSSLVTKKSAREASQRPAMSDASRPALIGSHLRCRPRLADRPDPTAIHRPHFSIARCRAAHHFTGPRTFGSSPPAKPVMSRIQKGWENFQQYLTSDTPPPLTDADTVLREDPAWVHAATAFSEAKRGTDLADAALAKARDELVALACHPREQGGGVMVTQYWKAGNVAYAKIPALQGLDLNNFRAKAREEVRVTASS